MDSVLSIFNFLAICDSGSSRSQDCKIAFRSAQLLCPFIHLLVNDTLSTHFLPICIRKARFGVICMRMYLLISLCSAVSALQSPKLELYKKCNVRQKMTSCANFQIDQLAPEEITKVERYRRIRTNFIRD